jgi:allantoin racemase
MKILWINPIGTDAFNIPIRNMLRKNAREGVEIDVISLSKGRPEHLEYHSYEALVLGDIVKIVHEVSNSYNGIIIGCFYDLGLREVREISKKAIVIFPCQASLLFASHLGNSFSILVASEKNIPKMRENVYMYGYDRKLASMRSVNLGVLDFQKDQTKTFDRLLIAGKAAVEEDSAEVLILGCTIEFGFYQLLQEKLGVPVIDPVLASFKLCEMLSETAYLYSWYPSRKWGSKSPPEEELYTYMKSQRIT